MSLINALGINEFAIVQFGIFILIFGFLTTYVFKPYVAAYEQRQDRTKGGEVLAEEFQHKTTELHADYESRARLLNSHIHEIFAKHRAEALAEYDRIVGRARQEATALIEKNRQSLATAVHAAADELKSQTPAVALAITNKLLGK